MYMVSGHPRFLNRSKWVTNTFGVGVYLGLINELGSLVPTSYSLSLISPKL